MHPDEDSLGFFQGLWLALKLGFIGWLFLALLILAPAHAEDAPKAEDPKPTLAFTPTERQYLLAMCDAAKWAARAQFDQCKEWLQAKLPELKPEAPAGGH